MNVARTFWCAKPCLGYWSLINYNVYTCSAHRKGFKKPEKGILNHIYFFAAPKEKLYSVHAFKGRIKCQRTISMSFVTICFKTKLIKLKVE